MPHQYAIHCHTFDLAALTYNALGAKFANKITFNQNAAAVRLRHKDGTHTITSAVSQGGGNAGHSERVALRYVINKAIENRAGVFKNYDAKNTIAKSVSLAKPEVFLTYKPSLSECAIVEIFSDRGPCSRRENDEKILLEGLSIKVSELMKAKGHNEDSSPEEFALNKRQIIENILNSPVWEKIKEDYYRSLRENFPEESDVDQKTDEVADKLKKFTL